MGEQVNAKLCILWEQEIRAAAKALAALQEEGISDDEYRDRAVRALNACLVALHHVDDDAAVVMVAAATVKGLAQVGKKKEKA